MKKKLKLKAIPMRYITAMAVMLFEIAAVMLIVILLDSRFSVFHLAVTVTQAVCVIVIIASDDNPDYKVPWLFFVLVLPIVGFMLYLMFYSRRLKKKFTKRLKDAGDVARYEKSNDELMLRLTAEDGDAASQARMLLNICDTHIFTNTAQQYFSVGDDVISPLLHDLEAAESFIYMEYFIIERGVFWDSILDVLKRKAADGVDVKLIYDDVGCMLTLPGNYYKKLRKMGIKATPFSMLTGSVDSKFNNRSHRKITVIDGKVGYTGGINLADEYINRIEKHGHWKDTAIRLEGEAVWELTRLFLIDYGINVRHLPKFNVDLFPWNGDISEDGYMIPFGDGPSPIYKHRVGKSVIQSIINGAERYVYMTTPYLIIDNELCSCIENAALRGVDVRILLPHVPDKRIIFTMTRSYYKRLMDAGVKIYEYEPGFLHAKSYLADDSIAMTGTVNLDYRSLVHHFENGVWMYKCSAVRQIKDDIERTLSKCIEVTPEMIRPGLISVIIRSVVRVFAPLL